MSFIRRTGYYKLLFCLFIITITTFFCALSYIRGNLVSSEVGRNVFSWIVEQDGPKTNHNNDLEIPPVQMEYQKNEDRKETGMYDARKRQLQQACTNNTIKLMGDAKDISVMHNLHIDRYHNLLYCQIQKVASTFIRKLINKLTILKGNGDTEFRSKSDRLDEIKQNLTFTDIHYIILKSEKIIFVREPYGRVLSGYVDKLFAANTVYWNYVGKYTVSFVRKNASIQSRKCGHDVTFPEFVKYLIQSEGSRRHTDRHFTPMYEHCRPCHISYDFIGKLETFQDDASYLINTWNKKYGVNIRFEDFERESHLQMAKGHINRIYSMKKSIVKCMSFHAAIWRTWRDLQMRGIIPITSGMPFTETQARVLKSEELYYEMKKAIESVTDKEALKKQREEAFIEAYGMVPLEDMDKLRHILDHDCKLFGYDCSPAKLFNARRQATKTLRYFNLGST